jgi:hypothetical protein
VKRKDGGRLDKGRVVLHAKQLNALAQTHRTMHHRTVRCTVRAQRSDKTDDTDIEH